MREGERGEYPGCYSPGGDVVAEEEHKNPCNKRTFDIQIGALVFSHFGVNADKE